MVRARTYAEKASVCAREGKCVRNKGGRKTKGAGSQRLREGRLGHRVIWRNNDLTSVVWEMQEEKPTKTKTWKPDALMMEVTWD